MSARLTTALVSSAIMRHTQASGGFATVLAKGDETGGAILIVTTEKGQTTGLFERILGPKNTYVFAAGGPQDVDNEQETQQYLVRRRANDPDLWLIELDVPEGPRFIAQLTAFG
jgi:hypothetical protein